MEENNSIEIRKKDELPTSPVDFNGVFDKKTGNELKEVDEAGAIVNEMHKSAIIQTVKNDESIQEKIVENAKNTIDNKLQEIEQNNDTNLQKATYNANEEACKSYGINNKVPLWQIKLMKIGHSFWFVIYWVFATITICPLMVFFNGISAFVKKSWIAIVVAIIIYVLLFVILPIVLSQIPNWIA